MGLMRLFTDADDDVPITLTPEPRPEGEATDAYAGKREAALAVLGNKWCLADTRKEQLEDIKNRGVDLV